MITDYVAMSTPKLKSYRHVDIPYSLFEDIARELKTLKKKVLIVVTLLTIDNNHSVLVTILLTIFCTCYNTINSLYSL